MSNPLTVDALMQRMKSQVEHLGPVQVEGEIRNFHFHKPSGHRYFSLAGDKDVLKVSLFRQHAGAMDPKELAKAKDGMKAVVQGQPSLYTRRSEAQVKAFSLQVKAALGEREKILREREERLRKEGLFDDAVKRPFPRIPARVSVIGSPESDAVRDVRKVHLRLSPDLEVEFLTAKTQGPGAGDSLAAALRAATGDCALLIRGGGSTEDLDAYREEIVVRAVRACKGPVATGIGHEADTTLADLAADRFCATPTAAADFLFPDTELLWDSLQAQGSRLRLSMRHGLTIQAETLENQGKRLPNALKALHERKTGELRERTQRLAHAIGQMLQRHRERMALAGRQLQLLSPLQPLERGFALVSSIRGRSITRAAEANRLKKLRIRFADGEVEAERIPDWSE